MCEEKGVISLFYLPIQTISHNIYLWIIYQQNHDVLFYCHFLVLLVWFAAVFCDLSYLRIYIKAYKKYWKVHNKMEHIYIFYSSDMITIKQFYCELCWVKSLIFLCWEGEACLKSHYMCLCNFMINNSHINRGISLNFLQSF